MTYGIKDFQRRYASLTVAAAGFALLVGLAGCAGQQREPRTTPRDKTVKGATIGGVAGAAGAVLAGKREADEILVGAAIGAVAGGAVGAYMDRQEEKLARIEGADVERIDEETLLVNFESDILFTIDSAVLDTTSRRSLDEVAAVLTESPQTAIVVQGHTDSTGSEAHNQELSERRAQSVHNYLVGRGVATERMVALGYGEGSPVASNATTDGRRLNRRVDILVKARAA